MSHPKNTTDGQVLLVTIGWIEQWVAYCTVGYNEMSCYILMKSSSMNLSKFLFLNQAYTHVHCGRHSTLLKPDDLQKWCALMECQTQLPTWQNSSFTCNFPQFWKENSSFTCLPGGWWSNPLWGHVFLKYGSHCVVPLYMVLTCWYKTKFWQWKVSQDRFGPIWQISPITIQIWNFTNRNRNREV